MEKVYNVSLVNIEVARSLLFILSRELRENTVKIYICEALVDDVELFMRELSDNLSYEYLQRITFEGKRNESNIWRMLQLLKMLKLEYMMNGKAVPLVPPPVVLDFEDVVMGYVKTLLKRNPYIKEIK